MSLHGQLLILDKTVYTVVQRTILHMLRCLRYVFEMQALMRQLCPVYVVRKKLSTSKRNTKGGAPNQYQSGFQDRWESFQQASPSPSSFPNTVLWRFQKGVLFVDSRQAVLLRSRQVRCQYLVLHVWQKPLKGNSAGYIRGMYFWRRRRTYFHFPTPFIWDTSTFPQGIQKSGVCQSCPLQAFALVSQVGLGAEERVCLEGSRLRNIH